MVINYMTTPTGYAEMFKWADGNPNNEDRAGCTVAIYDGDSIRIAQPHDTPIGVIGGDNTSVSVISGASPQEWHKKHLRDSANRLLWEKQVMVEWIDKGYRHWYESDRIPDGIVPPADAVYHNTFPGSEQQLMREILSEEYKNPGKPIAPYLPRWERKEWGIVVLLGRVIIREGSVCDPRWKRLKSLPGTLGGKNVEEWLVL